MSETTADTRPLQERQDDAVDRFHDIEATAHDLKDRLHDLDGEVTVIEGRAAALDEAAFDLAVERSGAMDLMSAPLSADDDTAQGIADIVQAHADDMRGPLVETADAIHDVRLDIADLETDLIDATASLEVLEVDVAAIRAEGGVFDPDAEAREEAAHEMDDHMQQMLHE